MPDIVVLEEWGVIDKWWTDSPYKANFVVVYFMGRKFVFKQTNDDLVWRIVKHEET